LAAFPAGCSPPAGPRSGVACRDGPRDRSRIRVFVSHGGRLMSGGIVAIISAFNEDDIIAQVIGDLVVQGVSVYFLDNGSNDRTAAQVAPFVGRGVIGVERFPADAEGAEGRYEWTRILQRKAELAHELDATWFIHHDADEFREGPWADLDLRAAIEKVDRFGYNAIDFEVLNFWPTHDDFKPGQDVREAFVHYEPGQPCDKLQIRCWKKVPGLVDLVSSGGHEAIFPGRKIFPIRFILRHYPIRGQAHGARKIFEERRPRFTPEERDRGWHVQYQPFQPGQSFLRDAATMARYDADLVRLNLFVHNRLVEELEALPETQIRLSDQAKRYEARVEHELDERNRELESLHAALHTRNLEVERLAAELDARNREAAALSATLHERNLETASLHTAAHERNLEIAGLHATLHERNLQIEVLNRQLDERNRQLERIRASWVWRVRTLLRREH
jgi:hypothetical protein